MDQDLRGLVAQRLRQHLRLVASGARIECGLDPTRPVVTRLAGCVIMEATGMTRLPGAAVAAAAALLAAISGGDGFGASSSSSSSTLMRG